MLQGQVRPGRVVAAAVQQDHIAFARLRDVRLHAVEIDATGFRVEITVFGIGQAHERHDRQVVRPGRVRHEDPHARIGQPRQLQRLTDGTRAAHGGDRGQTVGGQIAQHHRGQRVAIVGFARQSGIGLGCLRLPDALFGRLHGAHDRGDALRVLVDAHAQVDLALSGVGLELLDQHQDLVGALGFQVGQHQASPVAMFRSAKLPHSVQLPS